MIDRRQLAFEQTQKSKPRKRNKPRAPKLRKVGTSARQKQNKIKSVNETILGLEKSCRDLLEENGKLKKMMTLHAGDYCSLSNEADMFKDHWDQAEEANTKLQTEITRLNSLFDACMTSKEEINKAYNAGLTAFAWWKDGVQYVGTCGTLLKDVLKG